MKPNIGTLAIVGVAVVTAAVIGVMAGIILRAHERALIAQLTLSADQLSETIAGTTYHDMLENRREAVHREITTVGRQEGIEKVRLFNAVGAVMFSSEVDEIGHMVDKNAEACYACHAAGQPLERLPIQQRARIYRAPDGHRVLGVIRPIHNEQSCWQAACHAHTRDEVVLGVLDVNLSLAAADAQIATDQRRLVLLAVLAIAASSLLLWWLSGRLILRPVKALIEGTRRVARGDLSTAIPVSGGQELEDLAKSFNAMTRRLSEMQRQLTQSDKLASVGRLAAGVAHEINNPLTGVLTYASFLEKRAKDDPETKADLQVIVRETKRCRDIVKGMLDFARQTPPKRQPIEVNDVVRRAAAVVMNQLTLARVNLRFELAERLRTIPADANQLQQVLVNLLLNAADAIAGSGDAAPGGTITVGTALVTVPARGHAIVRSAACPRGCSLLDKDVRLAGAPAVRVLRRMGERESIMHMDPLYGRGNHRTAEPRPEGEIPAHLCPTCRVPLDLADRPCAVCGAPVFAVEVAGAGRIEWCARTGCPGTRWDAMDVLGAQPWVELTVEDTGRGIAAEDLDRVFDPFYSTKGSRGTGLGLAVTWGIVEGHGGSIGVESEPGKGTRFTVMLPCEIPDAVTASERPAPVPMPDACGTGTDARGTRDLRAAGGAS